MFTEEQQLIIDAVIHSDGSKIIGVNAVAGSGKSTTAKGIIDAVRPKNGLYTAFNKSVIDSAKKKMKNIDCRTLHSLAYKYLNYRDIAELTVSSLSDYEELSFVEKKSIVIKLNSFFVSKYLSYSKYCKDLETTVSDIEVEILTKLSEKKMPVPFNFLLKAFHLALSKNEIVYPEYDLIILDECQDTSAVALEIFILLKAKKRVMLGDTHQNIYSFMNTVNAFVEVEKDQIELYYLTQSFRCNDDVAEKVQDFGVRYFDETFKFRGTDNPPKKDGSIAVLTRTNSGLLEVIQDAIDNEIDFKLFRNPYEIADMAISLRLISLGKSDKLKPEQQTTYRYLINMYRDYIDQEDSKYDISPHRFFGYVMRHTDRDEELTGAIKFLAKCQANNIDLFKLVKTAHEKNNKKATTYLSTVHTFKGLEADTVYLHSSIKDSMIRALETEEIEPMNIMYVALSRARYEIKDFKY